MEKQPVTQRNWDDAHLINIARESTPTPVHDDLVDRQCNAQERNQIWPTLVTEHRTDEGKLYLCAIKDLYSNKLVGYSIDSRMKASLTVAALRNAVEQSNPEGTIVHSERGSQFRSR